jgi:FG-GAP-like repeat
MMRTKRWSPKLSVLAAATAAAALLPWSSVQASTTTCPLTSAPTDWSSDTLNTDTTKNGVVYDGVDAQLHLQPDAASFKSTALGINDLTVFAASADFDQDGWDDFVGTGESYKFLRIYRNKTFEQTDGNASNGEVTPDWADTNFVMPPKIVQSTELESDGYDFKWRPTAAADFNGDGWPDVFRAQGYQFDNPSSAELYLNKGSNDSNGDARFDSPYNAMASGSYPSYMGLQMWGGSNIMAVDYNGDRKIDLLVGSGSDNGTIRIFLNNCTLQSPLPSPLPAAGKPLPCASTSKPHFTYAGALIKNLGFGTGYQGGLPVFVYTDFDGDGFKDLIVGAPNCCSNAAYRLRVWKGISGGGLESSSSQHLSFIGAGTTLLAADFSLDGKTDLIATTDNWNYGNNPTYSDPNGGIGGEAFYYKNNGTSAPFSAGVTQQLTDHDNPTYDYDAGFVWDYDHDPNHTPDVMVADGNHTANFYVLANRVVSHYVDCGDVDSSVIDLGSLASSEMVVTGARLHPSDATNGGTITYYMSNEDPANWIQASDCGDGSGDVCVTFPKSVGREIRWKATMCSDSTHTRTPTITGVTIKFDYTLAQEHYRAGVVINDGVAYIGAFRQPGNRGKFYAVNAGLSQDYWEAGAKVDAMNDGARHIYTADPTSMSRLDFTTSNAASLAFTLQATDATQAATVVDWVRSARFGIGNTGIAFTRLGAIMNSTPAILTPPARPLWYAYGSTTDRARVEQFIGAQADRVPLVLVGAMDGMIHAFITEPTAITDSHNGDEAWAYIPAKVASGMLADYTSSLGGTLSIGSYPDGSPTLADIKKADGSTATIAVVANGNGGKSIATLDVTQTVTPTSFATTGPEPLWSAVPGDSLAGQAYSKPAVARVLINNQEKYEVIAATGIASDNAAAPWSEGRIVTAYDAETGYVYWQFKTACPVTSDVTVFETDDALEPGGPTINGYADRVVFADYCGYVYKLDPAKDLAGGWNGNAGLGTIEVDDISGTKLYALFSTEASSGALGAQSPIAGTIAARTDSSSRMVLFFGTGGMESWPATKQNAFYALYADDGAIRSTLAGGCSGGQCEKFYGGVVVTPDQVIFTRTTDPTVGTGTCDLGNSVVEGLKLNAGSNDEFVVDFTVAVASAVMGSLYGDRGAIYFATLSGDVARIGSPAATNAGDDSANGYNPSAGDGSGSGSGVGTSAAFTLLGWRQVL